MQMLSENVVAAVGYGVIFLMTVHASKSSVTVLSDRDNNAHNRSFPLSAETGG
jgi:hypothetical protein